MDMVVEEARGRRSRASKRHRVSVIGVLGELFITAGVLVLLFLGWQLWLNDLIVGNQQNKQASQLSQTWAKSDPAHPASPDRPDPGEPVVAAEPANAQQFATLIVPRFGADYQRPIAEGVGTDDVLDVGVGHYPGTQMPGAVGNVALAAHRTTWGAPFSSIADLQVGDSIYIETQDGWYKYVFRSLEYVQPTGVGVLDAVPQSPDATPTDRLLTMTSCNPKFSAAERFIAYSVFDTWYPRAGGPPPEIAAIAQVSAAG
ncbi:class E sortase [soil metagenome]